MLISLSSSAVLGEQIYGPYGNQRYMQGTMGTDKGYTGQFQDAATGLDYYNARYYDPVMGQFLSADVKQGNAQGFDPYAYAGENPETNTDPTGQSFVEGFAARVGIEEVALRASAVREVGHIPTKLVGHVSPSSKPTFSLPSQSSSSRHTSPTLTSMGASTASGSMCNPACEAERESSAANEAGNAQGDLLSLSGHFNGVSGQLNFWGIIASLTVLLMGLGMMLAEGSHLFNELNQAASNIANMFGTMAGMPSSWWTSQANVSNRFDQIRATEANALDDLTSIQQWWPEEKKTVESSSWFDPNNSQDAIPFLDSQVNALTANKNEITNDVNSAEDRIDSIMFPPIPVQVAPQRP